MTSQFIQPYAIVEKRSIDLTLSENPLGCSPAVKKAFCRDIRSYVPTFNKYPSANGNQLKIALSKKLKCSVDNIFIANGSEAIIFALPKILVKPSSEVLMPELTFPIFQLACNVAGLSIKTTPMTKNLGIDLPAMKESVSSKTKLIILCNPNNPTGLLLSRSEIINFLDQIPQNILIMIDEANIDFGGESVIDQALIRPNVIVLRTFSKGFGLANARVGFAVGNAQLIQQLNIKTQPFPISGISEQLAITALSDNKFIQQTRAFVDSQREKIKNSLQLLGFECADSQANNIFIRIPDQINIKAFFTELDSNDVSVVKGEKFGEFTQFFRISIRDKKTNALFVEKLTAVLAKLQTN